jgi:hypothetical protein
MRTTSAIRMFQAVALMLSLAVGLTLSLAPAAHAAPGSDRASAASSTAADNGGVVAQNDLGKIQSRIQGTTADGSQVTGTFTPQQFLQSGDQILVRGVVDGVVHGDTTRTFTAERTLSVASIQGLQCGILDLVLGPLDLDLLGLQVHLDQVVLTILAVTGANNLLGNLLCAVTGLLDGVAIIGQIIAILNEILDLFWPARTV